MVVRLLPGEEADGDKQAAEQQANQHDFPVGLLIGIVKGRGHASAIQAAASYAISLDF
jgi:hypothetical protein